MSACIPRQRLQRRNTSSAFARLHLRFCETPHHAHCPDCGPRNLQSISDSPRAAQRNVQIRTAVSPSLSGVQTHAILRTSSPGCLGRLPLHVSACSLQIFYCSPIIAQNVHDGTLYLTLNKACAKEPRRLRALNPRGHLHRSLYNISCGIGASFVKHEPHRSYHDAR